MMLEYIMVEGKTERLDEKPGQLVACMRLIEADSAGHVGHGWRDSAKQEEGN